MYTNQAQIMTKSILKVAGGDTNVKLENGSRFVAIALAATTIEFKFRSDSITTVTVDLLQGQNFPVSMYELVSTTGDILIGN